MYIPAFNVLPALIAAGAAIVSSVLGAVSVNKANKSNQQNASDTNASNERINQSQLDYNWEMFHSQNEYNNPSNAHKRMVDAGLNPIYYGLDGSSASQGNAYTPIASQQASPTQPNFSGDLSDAVLRYEQVRNLQSQTKKNESEAGFTDEQAETTRQMRSGQLVLLGQQIKLNKKDLDLKGAQYKETLARVDALRQSLDESQARITDLRSQMSQRVFDRKMQYAQFLLDKKYKEGLISLQEKQLVLGWFNANTDRINASTNYYNAETSRASMQQNAMDQNLTRGARIGFLKGINYFNRVNAKAVSDQNIRLNKAFNLEQINRAANAYISITDAIYRPIKNNLEIGRSFLGN